MRESSQRNRVDIMERRDVPERIREAAYILQGVFLRIEEEARKKKEDVFWVE